MIPDQPDSVRLVEAERTLEIQFKWDGCMNFRFFIDGEAWLRANPKTVFEEHRS